MPNDSTSFINKIQCNGKLYNIYDQLSRNEISELKIKIDELTNQDVRSSLQFLTHFDFPNIGDTNKLYIATDENKIYRFDDKTLTYKCVVGNTFDEIESIQISLK